MPNKKGKAIFAHQFNLFVSGSYLI